MEKDSVSVFDLYCDVPTEKYQAWKCYVPGLFLAGIASLSSAFISNHYNAPLTFVALLTGLSLNFLADHQKLAPGLQLGSNQLLKIGITFLGANVTVAQIGDLGLTVVLAVTAIASSTIIFAIIMARMCKFETRFGILAGGAVAICGASAALAIFAVQSEKRSERAELSIVLIGIAVLSAIAMAIYPIIAREAGLNDRAAGFFLGASVHDVAQALGAGYAFSPQAGATATIIKLTRVCLLAPLLAALAVIYGRRGESRKAVKGVPWFVLGFFFVVLLNSLHLIPASVVGNLGSVGSALIIVALTSAGIRSPVSRLPGYGLRPLVVLSATTIFCALLAFAGAKVLL